MVPLTKKTVTVASRVMLPTYAVLSLVFGLVYVIDPGGDLETAPVYRTQRDFMPLDVWGSIMLGIAALMIFALLLNRRFTFAYALSLCAVTWLIWAGAFAYAAVKFDNVTPLAPLLPLFVTTACVASLLSLLTSET